MGARLVALCRQCSHCCRCPRSITGFAGFWSLPASLQGLSLSFFFLKICNSYSSSSVAFRLVAFSSASLPPAVPAVNHRRTVPLSH